MYDVAVIGAGVIGGMIARELAAYELNVCLLEAENDVGRGSSSANSAIVHAGFDAKPGSLKARFNVEGSRMMEEVCRDLGVKYQRNGSMVVAFSDEDRRMVEELLERGRQNGVEGLYIAESEELHRLEPNLSQDAVCALIAPTGAIVCPYELTISAVGNAMDNGVKLQLNYRVTGIVFDGEGDNGRGCFIIASAAGSTVKARYVINAAGLYSDSVAAMAGDDSFRIRPRRGEYLVLDKGAGTLCSHTIFRTPTKMGKGILITPTVDGNVLLGPTSEDIDDKRDTSVTQEGIDRIISQMKQEMPAVNIGSVVTLFCGLRAVGNTGDFIINSPRPRFINVAAIESPGLTSSPAIGQYVKNLLLEKLAMDGIEPRRKKRHIRTRPSLHWFQILTKEQKNLVIADDPSFGHIICRCEGITEGEIKYAAAQNPRPSDLDGIKRRTRAQMGRCQGGFCAPFIVRILSDELEVPFESITKNGNGSYINIGKTKEITD
jgi:glycerol-3-phosphate dehydrogenase